MALVGCVFRTRDPALLAVCDIVVDVGGVYDPATHRYDHHQRSVTSLTITKPIMDQHPRSVTPLALIQPIADQH